LLAVRTQLDVEKCYRSDYQAVAEQRRLKINELETKLMKIEQLSANAKQPTAAAAPKSEYRELLEHEIIEIGDQLRVNSKGIWTDFFDSVGCPWNSALHVRMFNPNAESRTKRPFPTIAYSTTCSNNANF
jgi:hypothetical protein